jgi:hypothetical protein
LRERTWRFPTDGAPGITNTDSFVSQELDREMVETYHVKLPTPESKVQRSFVRRLQAVREDQTIVSAQQTNIAELLAEGAALGEDDRKRFPPGPDNIATPREIPPGYLSNAWVRLLPNLLLNAPAEPHTFTIFNLETQAMIAYSITPRGRKPLPEAADQTALLFEAQEGYSDEVSRLYVDETGRPLRLESGNLVMVARSEAEIKATYGARRDAAEALIKNEKKTSIPPPVLNLPKVPGRR